MQEFLMIFFVVISVILIGLILLQQGKGADMGASFGAGASGTVFGSSGSGNFLTRATSICATLFLCTALGLGYLASNSVVERKDFIDVEEDAASVIPEVQAPVAVPTDATEDAALSVPDVAPVIENSDAVEAVKTLDSSANSEDNTAPSESAETK